MKKLTLQPAEITVESFPTTEHEQARELLATRPMICDPATVPPRCADA